MSGCDCDIDAACGKNIEDLKRQNREFEKKLSDQIQLNSVTRVVVPIVDNTPVSALNAGVDEFIIENLRAGAQSPGFVALIQSCSREFLKNLTVDLSKYLVYDSPIFDIIMDAGYNPARLRDLDRAVNNVFTFNHCLPYMPGWRIIMMRVLFLAQSQDIMNVCWRAAVQIFDAECSHGRDYIQRHPDAAQWTAAAQELRRIMLSARINQID